MIRTNNKKEYQCECGKKFDNPQKFNGHKSNCEVHLKSQGKYDAYLERRQRGYKGTKETHQRIAKENRQKKIEQWISEKHCCETCGKVMTERFGSGRFCCRSCANSHIHSEETKNKIKASIHKCHSSKINKLSRVCSKCGAKLGHNNTSGLCIKCYRLNCPKTIRTKLSQKMKNRPRWNIHRNQISFAENFWMDVLNNNGIKFQREVAIKYDNLHCYFIDFEIIKNDVKIDLEIDGKQHLDRKEHDIKRDEFLSQTHLVYRVKWNDIKSSSGKQLMKEKIEKFISMYNNL